MTKEIVRPSTQDGSSSQIPIDNKNPSPGLPGEDTQTNEEMRRNAVYQAELLQRVADRRTPPVTPRQEKHKRP